MKHLFPTFPIYCVEQYTRNKEILNVKGQKSIIETTNQQCSNFRYSIYLENCLFKTPKGDNVPSFELNYIIGKIISIQGFFIENEYKNCFQKYGVITDISFNGFGYCILDIITNKLLCNNTEPIYEYLTYYPNSSIGFMNYFNEITYENKLDTIDKSNYYIDISNHLILYNNQYFNNSLFIISPYILLNENNLNIKNIDNFNYQIDCDINNELEHILHFYIENIKSKNDLTITFKMKTLNIYKKDLQKVGTIIELISHKTNNTFSIIIQSELPLIDDIELYTEFTN